MNMNPRLVGFSLVFGLLTGARADALSLEIEGLRSSVGEVVCTLYQGSDGFPDRPDKASSRRVSSISTDGKAQCRFDIQSIDPVAVAVLHDEDRNGKMRTNLIGIPQEGWAVTNNAPARTFGPPKYEDALIDPRTVSSQTLKILY